ncbi:DinB family protein [Leifsonia kafniensis]|uniref:DinB family protein n=1 Tax=Leifsonia kafniensis TaxID=475957 RepID=A0ABP7KIA7_9MICO
MTLIPDTKDWTWVLERPCPECGYDGRAVQFADIPALVGANAAEWQRVLERPDVRERPNSTTWSALEYAAHVRDVFSVFTARLELMLAQDNPDFANWDQDATALAERYDEQDPQVVATELADAAQHAAESFALVPEAELGRTGRRSDGAVFTVSSLGRYFVHDPVHHLHDVGGR